jgi:hypothetical protein
VHVGLSIGARRWYNPGLATALLLHIPFAVWAVYLLKEAGVIRNRYFNVYLSIGLVYTLGLPIMGVFGMKRYRKRMSQPA